MKNILLLKFLSCFLLLQTACLIANTPVASEALLLKYQYDDNGIRYQLISCEKESEKNWNWLFIPGGPGCDSSSLIGLTKILDLPGNMWLIDLPGNGNNTQNTSEDYNYEKWLELVIPMVKHFKNPIITGVSFGGMLILSTPELEEYVKAAVIVSSASNLWTEASAKAAEKYQLPSFQIEFQEYLLHPSEETCKALLNACAPYYFYKKESLKEGKKLLASVPFALRPSLWWFDRITTKGYSARWIPQKTPTLVIGNEFDSMTPFDIFQQDKRFWRPNIKFVEIKEASHFNWIDNPAAVKAAYESFAASLN